MHRRSLRYGLVVLLFAAAAGASAFAWTVDLQLAALAAADHDAASRFDRLVQSIARFDAAQQTFNAAHESEADWFGRVQRLLAELRSESTGLRTSPASAAAARTFSDVTGRVVSAVSRAEENFQAGHDLMAADLVQDEGRPGAEAMRAAAVEWRAAEAGAADATRAALLKQLWSTLGGTAALWALGVLLLAPRRASPAPAVAAAGPLLGLSEPAADLLIETPAAQTVAPPVPPPPVPPAVELEPAAALCGDIARADTTEALRALLERAAGVLGAAGAVIWMKGQHDELVPVVAQGYGPHALERLGALPLSEANVTTRAWHSGEPQSVGGDGGARGALAVPMFQGSRQTGVFAVELTGDAETRPATRALTSILAAQFAAAVAPTPEPAAATDPALEATGS